jgi:hypothetical protein
MRRCHPEGRVFIAAEGSQSQPPLRASVGFWRSAELLIVDCRLQI